MNDVLTNMLSQLSEEDKIIFKQLSDKLKLVEADIHQLEPQDLELLQLMQKKYDHKINESYQDSISDQEALLNQKGSSHVIPGKNQTIQKKAKHLGVQSTVSILEMPFAKQVRQIIARDLGQEFPQEEEAINFVFDNKWLPIECQNEALLNQIYTDFEMDIVEINQWRKDLVEIETDKKMAIGLAWFMVVFQLHKRFSD